MTAPDVEGRVPDAPEKRELIGDVVPVPKLLDPETDDATVCRTLHRIWSDQKDKYARYLVESELNERRRAGECNIWVQKTEDQSLYTIYVPAGRVAVLEQFGSVADRICQRFVSQLNQDPAQPNAIPSTGEDEDRDAADFATRVLKDACSEAALDANEAMRLALDMACSHGSGWIWTYTDPKGGGRAAVEVPAFPGAPNVDSALLDPRTGEEGDTDNYRFVQPEGGLADTPQGAAMRWLPKVARQVVPGSHVRLWPHTAIDLWDADGLLYLDYQPWHVAVERFPELAKVTPEQRQAAIDFRLAEARHLLPKKNGKPHDPKPEGREEEWLVLIACFWAPEGSAYPEGAYLVTVGNDIVAHRGTWMLESEDGSRERRDIPWTQVRQFRGGRDHPHGKPLMNFIGAGAEYLGQLYGRFEELMDMAANRKILLPATSTIQPAQLHDPSTSVLPFMPGGKPEYEQVPEPPRSLEKMIEYARNDINDASGLQESAQGLENENVNSGRQALAIVAQVNAGLSDVLQNVNRGWVRFWRVILQCIRSDYSVQQMLKVTGPDGSYKVERWTKSDLGSTRDVEIAKGSGTMLNPVQKAQMLAEMRQLAGIDPDDVQELMSTGLSPYAAFQDNRGLQRIRRQIAEWEKGPPPGWVPPPPPEQIGFDPAGNPVMGEQVPDPTLARMWAPVDSDTVPAVAKWRIRELVRAQQSKRYMDFPSEWRLALDMEFRRMVQAMQPPASAPLGAPSEEPPADPSKPALSEAEQAMAGATP